MLIAVHCIQEFLKGIDLRLGWIGMPFEVLSHPEDPPYPLGPHKCCLRDRQLVLDRWLFKPWPYFEYLDVVPVDPITEVDFVSNVRWGSTLLKKRCNFLFAASQFDFAQCHGRAQQANDEVTFYGGKRKNPAQWLGP